MTLLRGTTFPALWADRGMHEFTYSLLPHAGGWTDGETARRGWELNAAARVRPISACAAPRSFVSVNGANVVVEAIKRSEDGRGLIIRIYEPHGARGEVTVEFDGECQSVIECNHVEEDLSTVSGPAQSWRFAIRPFQIRMFRVLGLDFECRGA